MHVTFYLRYEDIQLIDSDTNGKRVEIRNIFDLQSRRPLNLGKMCRKICFCKQYFVILRQHEDTPLAQMVSSEANVMS